MYYPPMEGLELQTAAELTRAGISKAEAFKTLNEQEDVSFDYALPQPWLDAFAKWCETHYPDISYHLILSTTVATYHKSQLGEVFCTRCSEVYGAYYAFRIFSQVV